MFLGQLQFYFMFCFDQNQLSCGHVYTLLAVIIIVEDKSKENVKEIDIDLQNQFRF